jgi:glycosyltransferase involved in cell wall biosynthesis
MISVAIATYNGQEFIKEQLLSILNQTMPVDEIVICDDQSSDDTVKIIQELLCDKIYLYQNEKNLGYKLNFKKALSYCKGDYIFLCDQDDIWKPNKVQTMIEIMQNHPEIKALASTYDLIDELGNEKQIDINRNYSNKNMYKCKVKDNALVKVPFERLVVENSFQGCALCLRKQVNEKFQRCFSDDFHHDWLINILASEQNGMYFLNIPLFHYRIHSKNTIGLKGNVTLKGMDHLVSTNTVDARTNTAKNCIETLNKLEELDNELCLSYPTYTNYREFFNKHILYIENGKVIQLIIQNLNPYYKYFKTIKGRLMDIIVTFKVFINK